ncbi:hypothetical protein Q3G72_035059 [Acer saccharum]|nr:hypothetical protein Q3G72_035059 [Acer saccharum]
MLSQSEDLLNLSLKRMIDDYQGDPSEVELNSSDSTSNSDHHDGVTVVGPPAISSVGEVGESKVDPGSGRRDDDAEDPFYQSKREELEGLTDQEAKREEGWKCPCFPNCQPTKIVASVEPSEPVAKKSKKRPHTEEIQDKGLVIRVNSLTSSNAKIKKELEKARYAEIVAKEAMKGAVEKLAGLEEENTRLKASLKSSEDKLS